MTGTHSNGEKRSRRAPAVLPEDASWHSIGEVEGWLYAIFDPYGDRYVFFMWHDGECFAVSLVDPPLELEDDAAALGIQIDGRIGPWNSHNLSTILSAFVMSIAWVVYRAVSLRFPAAGIASSWT